MTPETRTYITDQVAKWHAERKAGHNLALTEGRIAGALYVAEAEGLLAAAGVGNVVRPERWGGRKPHLMATGTPAEVVDLRPDLPPQGTA